MTFLSCFVKPLAYLSLPVIILRTISASSPQVAYFTRIFVYLGTLASVATASIATAACLAVCNQHYNVNYYVARTFYALSSRLLDVKVELEGEEYLQTRPAVIMSNHQSILDILVVGRTMPRWTSMMAKKALQFSPVGPFMILSGAIFIDRGNNARAIRSLKAATDLMKKLKVSIFMFPEGTRRLSPEADLLSFKKGGFHMAVQGGLPILPIVTENYWHVYRKGYFGSGTIKVRVLPPVSTEGLTTDDVQELMDRVRGQMLDTLLEISTHVKKIEEKVEEKEEPKEFSGASIAINPSTPSSGVSLASSVTSGGSEGGVETEEDEGMVLVGRPE